MKDDPCVRGEVQEVSHLIKDDVGFLMNGNAEKDH